MCGITGFTGFEDTALLRSMRDLMAYRGPDETGEYVSQHASLGSRRLSVVDLQTGHQPLFNEDGDVVVVFNGEIYNHAAIRKELEAKRHTLRTHSDGEIIAHLYEEEGLDFVRRLSGMFSIALWDAGRKRLVLARDRLGIKPLYYCSHPLGLAFASELKALRAVPGVDWSVHEASIPDLLAFRCIPGEDTLVQGVKKLLPGHLLVHGPEGSRTLQYWSYDVDASDGVLTDMESTADMVRDELDASIRRHLMADVDVGLFLSGGVDSGALAAVTSKTLTGPLRTFSVGFEQSEYSELDAAREVSEEFSTTHEEMTIGADSFGLLPRLVWHFDEPIADPAAIPTYELSKLAARRCKVVLTGEGADELFAGYEHYRFLELGRRYLRWVPSGLASFTIPRAARLAPASLKDRFFPYSSALGEKAIDRLAASAAHVRDPARAYLDIIAIFNDEERKDALAPPMAEQPDIAGRLRMEHFSRRRPKPTQLDRVLRLEGRTVLPENLLMKLDKMGMAHGLEGRVPYLDDRLVSLASRIPSWMKLHGGSAKHVLRLAMKGKVPQATRLRPKQRFFVPIHLWLQDELAGEVEQRLASLVRRKVLRPEYVDKIRRGFAGSSLFYSRQLWSLLSLEEWYGQFVDQDPTRSRFAGRAA